jgi:hypothetical protein
MVAARYGAGLGAKVALFKAASRDLYVSVGRRFLDALTAEVSRAHAGASELPQGAPIDTPGDYGRCFGAWAMIPRMKALLEVGQFQRTGVVTGGKAGT